MRRYEIGDKVVPLTYAEAAIVGRIDPTHEHIRAIAMPSGNNMVTDMYKEEMIPDYYTVASSGSTSFRLKELGFSWTNDMVTPYIGINLGDLYAEV